MAGTRQRAASKGSRNNSGPAPARARALAADAVPGAKQKKVSEDPEMFATYLTLAREACTVVKAHKDALIDQIADIISDGVKQGAFEVTDAKASARAIFEATSRYQHPAHADEWKDAGSRRAVRCVAGAAAARP